MTAITRMSEISEISASSIWHEKVYTPAAVEKLLAGINMLGGDICPLCGTVKIKKTKCPVCRMGQIFISLAHIYN